MADGRKMLVIGAHSADFVWRAAGAMAVTTAHGGTAAVIALSYGERGESGELWKEPGQTVERVKQVREAEAREAAEAVGATFRCLDLGDYPLEVARAALEVLAAINRELAPNVIRTHTERDPYNQDHDVGHAAAVSGSFARVPSTRPRASRPARTSQVKAFAPVSAQRAPSFSELRAARATRRPSRENRRANDALKPDPAPTINAFL